MIVTRTPVRLSLFGGGTDMEGFWSREEGCVLGCTINKYIYVIVKKNYSRHINIKCFEQETAESADRIKHDLIRETMRKAGVQGGVDVVILSDIPHTGSGLGSSSSLTVGLLNAFYQYRGIEACNETLAREACEIEIDVLGKPIGKQDQYIASYGGMRLIRFKPDGTVELQKVEPGYDVCYELEKYLLLFYTGVGRKSEGILKEQSMLITRTRPILREMKEQVASALEFISNADIEQLGHLMRDGWINKRQLASQVSNSHINEIIEKVIEAGATGSKITGAGGGGFLLVFCKPEFQNSVRKVLGGLEEYHFKFDNGGTRVLFNDSGVQAV